jgi:hypothetical protein
VQALYAFVPVVEYRLTKKHHSGMNKKCLGGVFILNKTGGNIHGD